MSKQMKHGDRIQCSLGTCLSNLQIPDHSEFGINGETMGLISDNIGEKNIPSFCNCKRAFPPPTCTPTFVMEWVLGQELFKIKGKKALLDISFIPCIYGGVVTFVDKE